jgi:hypothetical protein
MLMGMRLGSRRQRRLATRGLQRDRFGVVAWTTKIDITV